MKRKRENLKKMEGIDDMLGGLPILQPGTTLEFSEYKDRIAEIVYAEMGLDAKENKKLRGTVQVVGYVTGVLDKRIYIDRTGSVHHTDEPERGKRLLLIREVYTELGKKESIWNDNVRVEIPLEDIMEYRQLNKS
jgi:hypothetical protein